MTTNKASSSEMRFTGIYKSLDAVKKCLNSEKYCDLPEVKSLLKIFKENYSDSDEVVDRSQRKVFVVLEGIDAAGKTTLSKRLSKLLKGEALSTPPKMLLGLRPKFDSHNHELRRAYYALGNYLAASQVRQIYRTKAVVMDRFWHSTAAYAIAHDSAEHSGGEVPPEGHDIYKWPSDLLKPDIVFFLSVSEEKRLERLLGREQTGNKAITAEENKMKDDKVLREALMATFSRMCFPHLTTVDSNVVIEGVLDQIKKILERDFQLQLPEIEPYCPKREKL